MSIDAELEELLYMGSASDDARSSPQSSFQSKLSSLGSPTTERGTTHRTRLNPRVITETSTNVCLVMVLATIHLMTTYFTYPYEEMLAMDFICLCSPYFDNRLRTLVIFIARLAIATISYLLYSIVLFEPETLSR
ncbi:hypothetical protein PYCCODRAFT_1472424 [Trametes coccinea BRFM310]|uniref:Uncharacterized protein n=1 Tax=Trametes coccinea (strain BRFM310) TaxID=1353009 RepID=A0A1Y2I9V4_TRAC3|nr:hypothetical protein PYCCODRAFT_1472424 [Trametes coccinea BRFM310]